MLLRAFEGSMNRSLHGFNGKFSTYAEFSTTNLLIHGNGKEAQYAHELLHSNQNKLVGVAVITCRWLVDKQMLEKQEIWRYFDVTGHCVIHVDENKRLSI